MSEFILTINGFMGLCVEQVSLPVNPDDDEEGTAHTVFSSGQCHAYAMAVQEELGGTLVGLGPNDAGGSGQHGWGHVGCRIGREVYDVGGKHASTDEWRNTYGLGYQITEQTTAAYLTRVSCPTDGEDDMEDEGDDGKWLYAYYRPNMDAARVYVKHALLKLAVEGAIEEAKRS